MQKNKNKQLFLGPVFTIMIMCVIVAFLSLTLSLIGISGQKISVSNLGKLEYVVIHIKNIISPEGIRYLLRNVTNSLTTLKPLALLIIALIGVGIGEKSGLFKAFLTNIKKMTPFMITFITILVSIVSSFFGDYAYVILIPLAGIFYKYASRNARLGILTSFIGNSIGYGTGIIFTHMDYILGNMTQINASASVDKKYIFSIFSNYFIMVGSTIILCFVGSFIIERFLAPKFNKKTALQDEDLIVCDRAKKITKITLLVLISILVYSLIPGLPLSGILISPEKTNYTARILANDTPFYESCVFLFTGCMMILGLVYGMLSKNINNSNEYSVGLSKGFEGIGYLFVLLFFTTQLTSILDFTNIPVVLSLNLMSLLSSGFLSNFTGILLILVFIIIVLIISILIPNTVTKWELISPIAIPLFMKANITPEFTQFIFRSIEGVGKCMSPIFPYFIVMLAFMQKYNYDEENKITIFGTIRLMIPTILAFLLLWTIILLMWFIIGIPIGPKVFATY